MSRGTDLKVPKNLGVYRDVISPLLTFYNPQMFLQPVLDAMYIGPK
jgi:hypothetical protein